MEGFSGEKTRCDRSRAVAKGPPAFLGCLEGAGRPISTRSASLRCKDWSLLAHATYVYRNNFIIFVYCLLFKFKFWFLYFVFIFSSLSFISKFIFSFHFNLLFSLLLLFQTYRNIFWGPGTFFVNPDRFHVKLNICLLFRVNIFFFLSYKAAAAFVLRNCLVRIKNVFYLALYSLLTCMCKTVDGK